MRIKEYRKAKGYTQKQMAKMLNISEQGTYSKKERGELAFKIEELLLLEEILEASISQLFADKKRGLKYE